MHVGTVLLRKHEVGRFKDDYIPGYFKKRRDAGLSPLTIISARDKALRANTVLFPTEISCSDSG